MAPEGAVSQSLTLLQITKICAKPASVSRFPAAFFLEGKIIVLEGRWQDRSTTNARDGSSTDCNQKK